MLARRVVPERWVQVELEPAVNRGSPMRPPPRVTVPSGSSMRHVREAIAKRFNADLERVQLIAGSRQLADTTGERLTAFEDSELLGERRRLCVLGVDLRSSPLMPTGLVKSLVELAASPSQVPFREQHFPAAASPGRNMSPQDERRWCTGFGSPSPNRGGYQPQLQLGYVCPQCGQNGLPDLIAAASHCGNAVGGSPPRSGFGEASPSPAAPAVAAKRRCPVDQGATLGNPGDINDVEGASGSTQLPGNSRPSSPRSSSKGASGTSSSAPGGFGETLSPRTLAYHAAAPAPRPAPCATVVTAAGTAEQAMSQDVAADVRGPADAGYIPGSPSVTARAGVAVGIDVANEARTVVQNEDGTTKVFGANTIASLIGSSDPEARQWVTALKDRELHGLVHELGKRLVVTSRQYAQQRKELEQMAKTGHFSYFGLKHGASEKDLHAAYRRMAKRMHPDKNGGTEEAKKRFQHMKQRYEYLKERYWTLLDPATPDRRPRGYAASDFGSSSKEDPDYGEDKGGGDEEEEAEDRPPQRTPAAEGRRIEYDPTDRGSMEETVWRMVRQMRRLQQGVEAISEEVKRSARAH